MLEELKQAYGKEYTFQSMNVKGNTQEEPWFTQLCPKGRIPVIDDHDRNGFPRRVLVSLPSYYYYHSVTATSLGTPFDYK